MNTDGSNQQIRPLSSVKQSEDMAKLYLERVNRDGKELLYVVTGHCGCKWCVTTQEIGLSKKKGTTFRCPIHGKAR